MASADLSADELALYDRQLRVWGAEGQNRIKNASILVINLNGVGTEIIKNLVLAGVGSVEIWDPSIVEEKDLSAQFFLSGDDLGKTKLNAAQERIQDLNPRVNLSINTTEYNFDNQEHFKKFNLIIANNITAQELLKLNEITRTLQIALYITESHGLYGFLFSDLIQDISNYTEKKLPIAKKVGPISLNSEIIKVSSSLNKDDNTSIQHYTIKSTYKPFKEAIKTSQLSKLTKRKRKNVSPLLSIFIALHDFQINNVKPTPESLKLKANELQTQFGLFEITNDEYFHNVLTQLNTELSPVAAIMGGNLAHDVINFLSKKSSPINNFVTFDGDAFEMPVYEL